MPLWTVFVGSIRTMPDSMPLVMPGLSVTRGALLLTALLACSPRLGLLLRRATLAVDSCLRRPFRLLFHPTAPMAVAAATRTRLRQQFGLSPLGFLPGRPPLRRCDKIPRLEEAAAMVWLANQRPGSTREIVAALREPRFAGCRCRADVRRVLTDFSEEELRRLHVVLTVLVHSFVWGDTALARRSSPGAQLQHGGPFTIPVHLALPYVEVSSLLGFRRPVLNHTGADLWNWRGDIHGDPNGLCLNTCFTGNPGEHWFHLAATKITYLLGVLMAPTYETQEAVQAFLDQWAGAQAGSHAAAFVHDLERTDGAVLAYLQALRGALGDAARVMKRASETKDAAAPTAAERDCLAQEARAGVVGSWPSSPMKLDPDFFYGVYRHYLQGWGPNENCPDGVAFELPVADAGGGEPGTGSGTVRCFLRTSDVEPYIVAMPESVFAKVKAAAEAPGADEADVRRLGEYVTAGASAGQAGVFQVVDAFLGVRQQTDFMRNQRQYMPIQHARFIEHFEATGRRTLKDYVGFLDVAAAGPHGREVQVAVGDRCWVAYRAAVEELVRFRNTHRGVANRYVEQFLPQGKEALGTGGTGLGKFLNARVDDTRAAVVHPGS